MIYYALQVLLLQALFLLFYDRFLRRESLFHLNRWYLLGTGVLSFILPLMQFRGLQKTVIIENLQPVILSSHSVQTQISEHIAPQYSHPLLYVYGLGALLLLGYFANKLFQIYRLIINHETVDYERNIKIVLLQKHHEAFSFANYIFIDEKLYKASKLPVLEHELVHYHEKHWLDLLGFEIIKILFWFSPFVWLYQKRLHAVHEFIADKHVLKQYQFSDYFQALLQEHFHSRKIPFINQFYKPSLLKTRIMIQKKNTSKLQAIVKYATFSLILTGIIVLVGACNSKMSEKKDNNILEQIQHDTVIQMKDGKKVKINVIKGKNGNIVKGDEVNIAADEVEVAFQFINNPPVFPGCEENKDTKAMKDCFSKHVQKFVGKEFNTDLAKKLGLDGVSVRIMTMFTIDKDGKVTHIKARSKYPALADEAKRVIASLPQMKPGKQKDKTVAVTYTLPIIFKIEE